MKTIYYVLLGVFVGAVLSFAYVAGTAPQPIGKQSYEITPVPTPAPVYTEPTPIPTEETPNESSDVLNVIVVILVMIAFIIPPVMVLIQLSDSETRYWW